MIDANIISVNVDRSSSGNITLQYLAKIETDTGNPVKIRIMEENGSVLYISDDYLSTPVELSKFFFLNNRSSFEDTSYSLLMYVEEEDGTNTTIKKTVDGFIINSINRLSFDTFQWSIKNFSDIAIQMMLQIVDSTGKTVLNSTERSKELGTGITNFTYKFPTMETLPHGDYSYRLRFYSRDENWNRFYPDEKGMSFEIRENTIPVVKIKDMKIREEQNYFRLTARILLSDYDLDNIQYKITDNFGNNLKEMINYTYSPRLERLQVDYPKIKFNSSSLSITVTVNDKYFGTSTAIGTLKLYELQELHRERDMFRWLYRNRSNKQISMIPQVLDFNGNILEEGNITRLRDEFTKIEIQDDHKFKLPREYYRFRLKLWSDEENWTEYHPNEYGTQFTRRKHTNPSIKVNSSSLYRDLDDISYVMLNVTITDTENDPIFYTLTDDNGYLIKQNKTYIETPVTLDIKARYDYIANHQVLLTLDVFDDNDGKATVDIPASSFRFSDISHNKGHVFNWYVDNFSYNDLEYYLVIYKRIITTDIEGVITEKHEEVFKEFYSQSMTIRPSKKSLRLYPKLPEGEYMFRLEAFKGDVCYPDINGINFITTKNTQPDIQLNYAEIGQSSNTSDFVIGINGEIKDIDDDYVKYNITDQFGNVIFKEDTFIPTPLEFSKKMTYNPSIFNTAKLYLTVEAMDEGDAINAFTETINLFEIQNLYKNGQEFYWSVRNFSKVPIDITLEIVDNEGNIAGTGKPISAPSTTYFREYRQIMDLAMYEPDRYFYRVKVTTSTDTWANYYPNLQGYSFDIIDNTKPTITNVKSDMTRLSNNEFTLNIKGSVNDNENDKVYITIKE